MDKKKILVFSGAGVSKESSNSKSGSIKQACDELGVHSGSVILNCRGIYKQTKGYKFEYYEEENFNI